ncbi:hypothetical protein [Ensifer sp. B1-9]|uniref:hypothetical protein n=1 Tax=Ensifer sp. B1-9 TaxID=3141455 RepID=UPI003D2229D1
MLDRPIQAAAEGLPKPTRADLAKRRAASIPTLVEQISTIEDIAAIFSSLRTLFDVAGAMSCQPKSFDQDARDYTAVGKVTEAICDYLGHEMDSLVAKVKTIKPQTEWDRFLAHGMIIRHEVMAGADAADIVTLAGQLAASEMKESRP